MKWTTSKGNICVSLLFMIVRFSTTIRYTFDFASLFCTHKHTLFLAMDDSLSLLWAFWSFFFFSNDVLIAQRSLFAAVFFGVYNFLHFFIISISIWCFQYDWASVLSPALDIIQCSYLTMYRSIGFWWPKLTAWTNGS